MPGSSTGKPEKGEVTGRLARIYIRTLDREHREWAKQLLDREWKSAKIVSRGRVTDASQQPGFVAVRADQPVGLATYRIEGAECELITLNSLQPGLGIGSALVAAVRNAAEAAGCRRLWVITTNDNMAALRFYQQRGFTLAALHKNALAHSRQLKPQIPLRGQDGIPLRDEIELEINLIEESRPAIIGLHHAQITIPLDAEEAGRHFYCEVLGLLAIDKPDVLKDRGGFWLRVGDRDLHIGLEDGIDRQATKGHIALQVIELRTWLSYLTTHGVEVKDSIPIPGFDRFEFRDPFGNRIEFIEAL